MKKIKLLYVFFMLVGLQAVSQNFITVKKEAGSFPVVSPKAATAIYTDEKDYWLVQKSASLLQNDIEMVTGKKPAIIHTIPTSAENIIIIGSVNQSALIQQLVQQKKLDVTAIKSKWEGYHLQLISNPISAIKHALVITGSDRRGTAYGVFELSEQMGISPWYWWADVPVKKKSEVYIKAGTARNDAPAVKYRGIFINDEAPAFSGWTKEKFGGVNHNVYEKVFELLLRMKANYLWPAMWGNAFNDDDTLNPILADKYGIVMGTSHHEPMLRAQQEWKRYGKGEWNYNTNDSTLRSFWRKGIQNMGSHESIVTVGMRGDGDMPMTQGTAIGLLERIVKDQRQIIQDVTGKQPSATPQMWALYKEVQDYYDKGMQVPDDVTLLLCDDNWGNIRKLPKLSDKPRSGGYGIYYHFDYVGGPRNYKWINTNNIARVWEQMHLAYEYNVRNVWIVNVGDLKPMEFPINFFLDYAWNTKKWNEDNLRDYYTRWAAEQFGEKYAKEIGSVLRKYSQYSSRRKPELLDANTYSVTNYNVEWMRVINDWKKLLAQAEKINQLLSPEYKNAFFELVLHPVKAMSNLHDMYFATALNNINPSNNLAEKIKQLFINDSLISVQYNQLAGGKWNHMMDQTHIGYTYWQQPLVNKMPPIKYAENKSSQEKKIKIEDISLSTTEADIDPLKTGTKKNLFNEVNGYVSIQASHYTKAINTAKIHWKTIPDIGKDGDGITTFPVTETTTPLNSLSPHLEYDMYVYDTATVKVHVYLSPTLNFHNEGLRYAISIDDEKPQVINMHEGYKESLWNKWVADNIIEKISQHKISKTGLHVIKFWMVDPAVVLQKIAVDLGGLKPSYLGPEETKAK